MSDQRSDEGQNEEVYPSVLYLTRALGLGPFLTVARILSSHLPVVTYDVE
jgi:hypothetical protein